MKKKKFAALLLVLTMCIGLLGGFQTVKADDLFIDVESGVSKVIEAEPGTTTHVKLPVRALNVYISSPTLLAEPAADAPFKVSNIKLTKDNTIGDIMGLAVGERAYIEFDIVMKDTATIGNYNMGLKVSYTSFDYADFNESTGSYEQKSCSIPLVVQVTKEKAPAQITISDITYDKDAAAIGNTFDISFTVKNEGEIEALNTYFSLSFGETGLVPGYSVEKQKLGDLKSGVSQKVTVPVTVLPTAAEGFKTLTANFSYKNADGKEDVVEKSLYVTVQKTSVSSSEDAKLVLTGETYEEDIKAGTSFVLNMQLENVGEQDAKDIKLSISKGTGLETGIIEDYEGQILEFEDLAAGGTAKVELPLLITKSAVEGLKELTVQATYTDSEGISRTAVTKFYLMVIATDKPSEELTNKVVLESAVQSPSNPLVGETVSITFTVRNKGDNKASDIKVSGDELSSSGFEPVTSDPSKSIGNLEPGEKAQVTMKFKVGSNIAEGTNPLKMICEYNDSTGKAQQATETFYIMNVTNDSKSKPKLIIDDYGTDLEELRAGSTFKLSFNIKNTHISKVARNIKVTLSQEGQEKVFAVAEGSDSVFLSKIAPGETSTIEIPLEVKNDAKTGTYEIKLTMEYDYDNMPVSEDGKAGATEIGNISLQAIENARPVIQNVSVGNWDTPTVGIESSMTFDFYNMGKSTLNNVYFTLEGDFALATGTMLFLGPVTAGGYEQVELMVLPSKEGSCSGKVTIHFEDSNGDETTIDHEFSDIMVQAAYIPGGDIPGGDIPADVPPLEPEAEPIVSLGLFLAIQAGLLIVVIPVVRMLGIKLHKKKLLKEDEA